MKRLILVTLTSLVLLLAGCNRDDTSSPSTPTSSKDDFFEFVPADTPYLFASTERMPADVLDKMLESGKPALEWMSESLGESKQLLDSLTAELEGGDTTTHSTDEMPLDLLAFFRSLLDDWQSNFSVEGFRNLGLRADTRSLIYGIGPFPVMRMEVTDEEKFRAMLDKAFRAGGSKLPAEQTMEERKYWLYSNDKLAIITSIDADDMIFSVLPSAMLDQWLPSILGLKAPAESLDVLKNVDQLRAENDYSPYFVGWVDSNRFLDLVLDSDSQSGSQIQQMLEFDPASISPVCKQEYRQLANLFPMLHYGSKELNSRKISFAGSFVIEPTLAGELQNLSVENALPDSDQGGLLNMGFALNLAKAREWLLTKAQARVENPFQCQKLAWINQMSDNLYTSLNRPLPPFIGNFMGFKLQVDDADLQQLGGTQPLPEKIKAMFAVITTNPEMLVGMGQMLLPEIAGLNLTPGAEPVSLKLDAVPVGDLPTWAASSDNAIGIAAGEGMHKHLQGFLNNGTSKDGRFLTLGMDASVEEAMLELSNKFMPDDGTVTGKPFPNTVFYERSFMSARFTDKGIVFEQDTILK